MIILPKNSVHSNNSTISKASSILTTITSISNDTNDTSNFMNNAALSNTNLITNVKRLSIIDRGKVWVRFFLVFMFKSLSKSMLWGRKKNLCPSFCLLDHHNVKSVSRQGVCMFEGLRSFKHSESFNILTLQKAERRTSVLLSAQCFYFLPLKSLS